MNVSELMKEGLARYATGDVAGAVACWEEILRDDSAHVQARRYLDNVRRMQAAAQNRTVHTPSTPAVKQDPWGTPGDGVLSSVVAAAPVHDALAAVVSSTAGQTAPPSANDSEEVAALMKGARDLYSLHDFSGAMELLGKVVAMQPRHVDALALRSECQDQLLKMLISKLGGPHATFKILLPPEDLIWLNIDHRAAFVLSHIDGRSSVDEVAELSGMERLTTLRIMVQLLEAGAIGTVA
jgi:hypothetical protein